MCLLMTWRGHDWSVLPHKDAAQVNKGWYRASGAPWATANPLGPKQIGRRFVDDWINNCIFLDWIIKSCLGNDWSLFLRVQLTISQPCFRWWIGVVSMQFCKHLIYLAGLIVLMHVNIWFARKRSAINLIFGNHPLQIFVNIKTHCVLVTPYCSIERDHHWIR